MKNKVVCWRKDADGRVLSTLVNFNSLRINLINVYAPTAPVERAPFFQSVHSFLFPHSECVIGVDFNCYDCLSDKFGGNVSVLCFLILNPVFLYGMRGEHYTLEILSLRGSVLTSRLLVV